MKMGRIKKPGITFLNVSSFRILIMFRRGMFYSYLSIYLRYFLGLSVTETTFFATFPMVINIILQMFVWGIISDKFQKRRTLIILGEVSAAIITTLVWYIHTFPTTPRAAGYVIIIGLTILEVFWSMSNVGWSALISDLYPEHRRAGVQGKLMSIGAIGRIVGVWIGGLAYDGFSRFYEGWGFDKGLLFFIASSVMLISTIPMFFVPEGGIKTRSENKKELKRNRTNETKINSYSKHFLFFLFAMVLINFGRNSIAIIKAQYISLDEGFNVSSNVLGYIVNMQSIAIFLSGLFIGKLTRRFSDVTLLLFGALAAVVYLTGFVFGNSLTYIFASNFVGGASQVIILASAYSYASKLIPATHRGRQFALFNATFFLSWGVAATLIAGPIVDLLSGMGLGHVFSYKMSFVVAAILVIAGIFVLTYVIRKYNHPSST